MPKNYYLYMKNGKVRRQVIDRRDIYPESTALGRIPPDCDVFARIEFVNWEYRGVWQKHELRPVGDDPIDEKIWKLNQQEYKKAHIPLLTDFEKLLLDK